MTSTSKSIRRTCASTSTVRVAPAVSTSTARSQPSALLICRHNTVVQCQNDRSQHKNKAQAMNQLKAKLYELEMFKRRSEASAVEDAKADVGWGSQIRNYVLDQSRIKDLRTGVETGNTQAVLDGGLDAFIEASLKQGL